MHVENYETQGVPGNCSCSEPFRIRKITLDKLHFIIAKWVEISSFRSNVNVKFFSITQVTFCKLAGSESCGDLFSLSLVDWCKDATLFPSGDSLIDLSPRTEDFLCHCTKSGKITSKLQFPESLKLYSFKWWQHKFSFFPSTSTVLPQPKKQSFWVSPKTFFRILCNYFIKLLIGIVQELKKVDVLKD